MSNQKSRTRRTLHYFWSVLKKRKLALIINFTFTPLAILFGEILVGYEFGKLFQKIVELKPGDSLDALYHIAWLIIAFYLLQIVFYRINDYTAIWRQTKGLRDLEQDIFKKLPSHGYRFFSETYGGALVSQVNRFLKSFEQFDDLLFFSYLETFSRTFLAAGILLVIAPPLGLLILVWAPIFIFASAFVSIKKSPITRVEAAADSKVIAFLADAITNMITVKTFARARSESRIFNSVSNDRLKKRYRSYRFNAHIRDFRWFMVVVFFVTYVFLSIHLVASGAISSAAFVSGQIYVFAILSSLLQLHQVIQRTEQLFADAAELTDVLDMPPELEDPKNPEEARMKHGLIEFKSVSFTYPGTTKKVFDDLQLTIPAGQKVGLVGHSGSGKSTITRLVLRFLDIKNGSILIDGQDVSRITQDDLRGNIAFVPQEPLLFHRSIKDNIGYGREGATDAEIHEAARLAYADDFIEQLPEKYDTLVGERGVKLSGGEKQRVAIARAMLTDCPLLILDEATSALDSKSEKLIARALDALMKDRTTIVIAHRLSTIRKLDRIIVLRAGKIVEDGTHAELLKQNGEYAELWNHQSGNFLED